MAIFLSLSEICAFFCSLDPSMLNHIYSFLDTLSQTVIDVQRGLVSIPALAPENGGDGERQKADLVKKFLGNIGLSDVREYNAPDLRVSCGHRPNIVTIIPGEDTSRTFWIVTHMDVVPPGERALWKTDPYTLCVEGDLIYGRGVADNHQGLVSSFLLAKALKELKIRPPINYGLVFVSDEETGNKFGIDYLLDHHSSLFKERDLFLVPDFKPDAGEIEIAEKSVFWLKITVEGQQCHAAFPREGRNSLVATSAFILALRDLYKRFSDEDDLFYPAGSTFEPTKKDANVESINTLPGRDVFYLDCRVLPHYRLDDVMDEIRRMGGGIEADYGVKIRYEAVKYEQASSDSLKDSEIVQRLFRAVPDIFGCVPRCVGIGGFTAAFSLRRKKFPAAVWDPRPLGHVPNEPSSVSATLNEAKVMAHVLFGGA